MKRQFGAGDRLGTSAYYKQWKTTRATFLATHRWCAMCAGFGVKRLATEVDHIVSRAERPDLTFTWSNLQGLCIPHHNSAKARDENAGYSDATASDGWPSDPKHPQNR